MKHKINKLLCLVLALLMVIGMLPATMFASAAPVVLESNQMLVDDDFAGAGAKDTVTASVGGVEYQAVFGVNAFATVIEAVNMVPKDGRIYVAAGEYTGNFSVAKNMEIYGNGMNVNPNNADWSANSARSNLLNESVFDETQITVSQKGMTKFILNGFTFTGKSTVKEATAGSTFKGVDISYNCFYDNEQISAAQGCLYFTGTTVRSGRLAYNRIENKVAAAKPLTFRNADNFNFIGNYVNVTADVGFWLSGEIADQNTTPGKMKMVVEGNRIISNSTPVQPFVQYCDLFEATFRNNYLTGKTPLDFNSKETSTPSKKIVIEGNTLEGTTRDLAFRGACPYDPSLITIKNNTFKSGNVTMEWLTINNMLDMSYNTFLSGPSITTSVAPITYPRYNASGDVLGEMVLEEVTLTGVLATGDKANITGISIEEETKTVSIKDVTESIYNTIEINAKAKANKDGSTSTIKYYSDPACTVELTGGNVIDYLKQGKNLVYIKLVTSLDNYSYKIYTLTIPREACHDTDILGVKDYENTVGDGRVDVTIPTNVTSPNIRLNVSSGASYRLYLDEGLTKPLNGTVIKDLPAGSSTYYVQVTAEDGIAKATYLLSLSRAPYANTDIVSFNAPEYVAFDEKENAYLGVYTSTVDSVDVDVVVGERATWELFADESCANSVSPKGIALNTGDNIYYVKVTAEAGSATAVHRLILRKETATASKQIFAVTSDAVSSEVGADTVSILLSSKVTTYIPAFEYAGSYWKLFASYEDGVLGDQVSGNKLVDIAGGNHTYYIEVIAADGSSRVYTLYLEREFATDALLTAIGGGLTSYVDRFDFVATTQVQNEGAFTPTFTVSDKATVTVLNAQGGEVTLPINLKKGENNFVIVVTAENGSTKTEYAWTVTCIGDDIETLSEGVVYDIAWAEGYALGDVIYVAINGETYKVYFGENAFGQLNQARAQAAAKGGIIYVMPGNVLDTSISLAGIKLYGPNFAVDANIGNRYPESYIEGKITMSGSDAEVCGFTVAETGWFDLANKANRVQIANNIFAGDELRENPCIRMNGSAAYENVAIKNNLFDVNSEKDVVAINNAGAKLVIANNVCKNSNTGAFVATVKMAADSTLEIASNVVTAEKAVALALDGSVAREGYLYIHDNTITAECAISMNANKAEDTFVLNFYNNKVETSKLAVNITSAPASFATNFTANENVFSSIALSFLVEYKGSPADLLPMDIERNYYGTATPGNNVFDGSFDYKPYYLDADKTMLSDVIQPYAITVGGRELIDDGSGIYAIVSEASTELKIAFDANDIIPADALGTAVVWVKGGVAAEQVTVDMTGNKTAYATVISADGTASETKEFTIYPQTANPVYNVYDVISHTIENMKVAVVVDHRATAWTPAVATVDALPIAFYADAECTEALTGSIALTEAKTTVYGVVGEYEPVTFEIYKKQSSEKAVLSLKDAYTFEYTGSNTIDVAVDNRLTAADLSAVVSAGSSYEVFGDATCSTPVDESNVAQSVTELYYKVTAADSTYKVFEISITWIDVTDPVLLGIENTTTESFENDKLVAQVKAYNANEGFVTKLTVAAGCSYKLYIDETRETVFKNNTVYFSSNYVYVYVTVTSPDGVLSKDYDVTLTRDPGTIKFADQAAIPNWAKEAVEVTKHLGIVTGEKYGDGYLLNANGKATREVMAAMMVRMMGIDATQYSYVDLAGKFADADQISKWAVTSMKAAVALNIFVGAKNGDAYYLNPKSDITRQEFAVVFVKAIGEEDMDVKADPLNYKDAAKVAKWARSYVKIVSKLGLMQGSYGNFKPKDAVTRAEIIQTIYNYMY